MDQLTIGGLVDELAFAIGTGANTNDDSRVSLRRYIDWAGQFVWERHPWPERLIQKFVPTVIPYATGTVAVTVGSATVTGTGTTWTSAMTGRRFALSYGGPWYRFTYVGATSGTLDRAYVEATNASASYVIYADEYALDTSLETIQSVGLLVNPSAGMTPLEERTLEQFAMIPTSTGTPRFWCNTTPLASAPSTRRIRVWPIPTTAWTIAARGLSFWTHSTTEGDTPPFHQDREPVVLFAARYYAQQFVGAGTESRISMGQVVDVVDTAWEACQKTRPRSLRIQGLNRGGAYRGPYYGPVVS